MPSQMNSIIYTLGQTVAATAGRFFPQTRGRRDPPRPPSSLSRLFDRSIAQALEPRLRPAASDALVEARPEDLELEVGVQVVLGNVAYVEDGTVAEVLKTCGHETPDQMGGSVGCVGGGAA